MSTDWRGVDDIYLKFLQSDDDRLRRELLDPIMLRLLSPQGKDILDLGCGEGYFARMLKSAGTRHIAAVDISAGLIARARELDPAGDYRIYDIVSEAPFVDEAFDAACAHMVMMDISDIEIAYKRLNRLLRNQGKLVISIVNPYYAFPVGRWSSAAKAHHAGDYFFDLLYITHYFQNRRVEKNLSGSGPVPHFHRQLADYINIAARNGFVLEGILEPPITPDLHRRFKKLNLAQALVRVPLFLVLSFRKLPEADAIVGNENLEMLQEKLHRNGKHFLEANSRFYADYRIAAAHGDGPRKKRRLKRIFKSLMRSLPTGR